MLDNASLGDEGAPRRGRGVKARVARSTQEGGSTRRSWRELGPAALLLIAVGVLLVIQGWGWLYRSFYFNTFFEAGNASAYQRRFGVSDLQEPGTAAFQVMQLGFYAQDHWEPIEGLVINPGVRVDVPFLSDGVTNDVLLNNPELATQISTAVNAFMDDPQNLEIKAAPAAPVPFAQLMAAGMGNPLDLAKTLNVSVTANQSE